MDTLLLFSITLSFGLTYYLVPLLKKLALQKQLYDMPDERKKHAMPIPSLGGVAIFVGFFTATMVFVPAIEMDTMKYLLAGSLLMVILGIYDDLTDMKASRKAMIQLVIVTMLFWGGFRVGHIEGIPFLEHMSVGMSYLITSFLFLLIINAYNLIDGIDGLAGSLGLLACILFGGLFFMSGMDSWGVIALSMGGALLAFLRFNFYKASIFMGDTGSMLLGLMITVFGIQYLNCCGENSIFNADNLLLVCGIIMIPVIDLFRVAITRMMKGHSPLKADRTHIHHILLNLGMSTPAICTSLILLNLITLYCATCVDIFPIIVSLPALALITGELFFLLTASVKLRVHIKEKGGVVAWYTYYRKIKSNL